MHSLSAFFLGLVTGIVLMKYKNRKRYQTVRYVFPPGFEEDA